MPSLSQIASSLNTMLANFKQHRHTGTDAPKINYNDLINTPGTAKQISFTPAAGSTLSLDVTTANENRIQMPAGNITLSLPTTIPNALKFIVSITQDSVGSRTVTWFTTIRWAGGTEPTLTTTASKRDTFGFICTGAGTYDGFIVGQDI